MTPEVNDWNEYKRLILHEFENINKSIQKLGDAREEDARNNREELKETVAKSEKRICAKLYAMERRQKDSLKKLEETVQGNVKDIVALKINAAKWGAFSGVAGAVLIEVIKMLLA